MKQFFIITALFIFCKQASAQEATTKQKLQLPQRHMPPVRIDPLKNKLQYNGYTILLLPTYEGYYGYDILKDNKMVVHQITNPAPGKELTTPDDAFTTAKQVIDGFTIGSKPGMVRPNLKDPAQNLPITHP